jgi:hypothetical protein
VTAAHRVPRPALREINAAVSHIVVVGLDRLVQTPNSFDRGERHLTQLAAVPRALFEAEHRGQLTEDAEQPTASGRGSACRPSMALRSASVTEITPDPANRAR